MKQGNPCWRKRRWEQREGHQPSGEGGGKASWRRGHLCPDFEDEGEGPGKELGGGCGRKDAGRGNSRVKSQMMTEHDESGELWAVWCGWRCSKGGRNPSWGCKEGQSGTIQGFTLLSGRRSWLIPCTGLLWSSRKPEAAEGSRPSNPVMTRGKLCSNTPRSCKLEACLTVMPKEGLALSQP